MKQLSCTFQHFHSGMHVSALYKRKRLIIEMMDSLDDMKPYIDNDDVYLETEKWCKDLTGKRFETVDDAKKYLIKLGVDDYLDFEEVN